MMPEEIIALREEFWGRSGSRREKLVRALFTHIDEQASQIATLKAALRKDRFFRVWANTNSASVDTVTKIAGRQLAKEYPEINWEET